MQQTAASPPVPPPQCSDHLIGDPKLRLYPTQLTEYQLEVFDTEDLPSCMAKLAPFRALLLHPSTLCVRVCECVICKSLDIPEAGNLPLLETKKSYSVCSVIRVDPGNCTPKVTKSPI